MSTSDSKLFLVTFWYNPAHSIRQLLVSKKGHTLALVVVALFGMVQLNRLFPVTSEASLLLSILHGFIGIACLFLISWLMRNFGRWFGADVRQRDVRTALGLGILPWTLLFVVLGLLLAAGVGPDVIAARYSFIVLIALVYGFYVLLFSLSAALGLGIIKTFACLSIAVMVSLFPLTFLAQLLSAYLV